MNFKSFKKFLQNNLRSSTKISHSKTSKTAKRLNEEKKIDNLYEKNSQSALNEKTAMLNADLEMTKLENARLNKEVASHKRDYTKLVIAAVLLQNFISYSAQGLWCYFKV